jgi:hypothetical protein
MPRSRTGRARGACGGRGALGRRGISSGGLRDVDGPVYLVGARLGLRHVPRGQALAVNP